MKVMGLDYGTKTVGVAVSDELFLTAQSLETITRKSANKLRQTLARIEQLVKEHKVGIIVLGYPKNMNNTLGDRAKDTESFKEDLERRTGLKVILWDERLTTMEAERILIEGSVRRENRKSVIDQMAASIILQSYLDANREKLKENNFWLMWYIQEKGMKIEKTEKIDLCEFFDECMLENKLW